MWLVCIDILKIVNWKCTVSVEIHNNSSLSCRSRYCKPEVISWWKVNITVFYTRFLSPTDQKCESSAFWQFFYYWPPSSAWNGRPWPGRSQNWMLMYFIINLSGSQQFSGSSIQNQVELSEWATGRLMHWPSLQRERSLKCDVKNSTYIY